MEVTCFSETSVDFQRTKQRHIPQDRTLRNHVCKNLISLIVIYMFSDVLEGRIASMLGCTIKFGGCVFLRNVSKYSSDYMKPYSRRHNRHSHRRESHKSQRIELIFVSIPRFPSSLFPLRMYRTCVVIVIMSSCILCLRRLRYNWNCMLSTMFMYYSLSPISSFCSLLFWLFPLRNLICVNFLFSLCLFVPIFLSLPEYILGLDSIRCILVKYCVIFWLLSSPSNTPKSIV
jgi:hypothetical protein